MVEEHVRGAAIPMRHVSGAFSARLKSAVLSPFSSFPSP